MNAADALALARRSGVAVKISDGDLLLEADEEPPAQLLEALTEQKPAIIELLTRQQNIPQAWTDGLGRLNKDKPIDGFAMHEWRQLIEDARTFLNEWGGKAARLGWSTEDIFGVHPRAPAARYDAMGVVPVLSGRRVISISKDQAAIRTPSGSVTYYRRPSSDAVPIWELNR